MPALSEAMRLMEQMQQMDELEQDLDSARFGNNVDNIDAERVADLVGAEEGQALKQLQELTKMLEEAGYRVLAAIDGPSGLKILEADVRIDLLITDVGLPGGLNGRQVADAARAGRPDLKVLFVTGYSEGATVGSDLLEDGMQVLTKPFSLTVFASKVQGIINA